MKWLLLLVVVGALMAPAATGQIAVSSAVSIGPYCLSVPNAALVGVVASGVFQYCIAFPSAFYEVGNQFWLTATFTGPAAGLTPTFTIINLVGCTAGTITQSVGSIATTGIATARVLITTTNDFCSGVSNWNTAGATMANVNMAFASHSLTQSGSINTPDVAASITDFTDNLCPSGECALGVDVLDDSTDDGILTTTGGGNITVQGNISVNGTLQGSGTDGGGGFQWSLYVLFMAVAFAIARSAEQTKEYGRKVFAGILFMVVGFIAIWEQAELGFDEIPRLLVPMLVFTMLYGAWHLKPFKETKK